MAFGHSRILCLQSGGALDRGDIMITLFSGTPGSGKSLHLARQILVHLRLKHYVIANFDLNREMIKKWEDHFFFIPNDKLNPNELRSFAVSIFQGKRIKEDSIYLVIDESQMLFNSREWGKRDRKPFDNLTSEKNKIF